MECECVPTGLDTVGMRDAVVHVDDVDGLQGVMCECMSFVERVNLCEEVEGVFAVVIRTIEGYYGIEDTIYKVCRPGRRSIY